jgi:uncharacterized protein involved in outer membrane biogenesis
LADGNRSLAPTNHSNRASTGDFLQALKESLQQGNPSWSAIQAPKETWRSIGVSSTTTRASLKVEKVCVDRGAVKLTDKDYVGIVQICPLEMTTNQSLKDLPATFPAITLAPSSIEKDTKYLDCIPSLRNSKIVVE